MNKWKKKKVKNGDKSGKQSRAYTSKSMAFVCMMENWIFKSWGAEETEILSYIQYE